MACSALDKIYCPIDTRPATHALITHKPKLRKKGTDPADRFGETDVGRSQKPHLGVMPWTAFNSSIAVHRSIRLSLSLTGAAALALAGSPIQPVAAQQEEGSAEDLGVMEIKLKDAAWFNWGFQGTLQGAAHPIKPA